MNKNICYNIKSKEYICNQSKLDESSFKINDSIVNQINLPKEPEPVEKLELIEENLMFEYKPVSAFKLYYAINGKFELFLMILATILTIGAGCSNALKSTLLGDTINNLALTSHTENMTDDEYEILMDTVEPKVNKQIKKFLIYGSIIFVLKFLSQFLWLYSGLRQIHKLKMDYFSLILRQEQG